MTKTACTVPITQIILDEDIYPREGVSLKRVSMFAENMRDGFEINPIEVQIHPDYIDKYRILDGAHRLQAYKEIGATKIPVHIITLDGLDPILYAAKKAIGPLQLTEDESRTTARRAFQNNSRLTSAEIGKAIGRSRRTVDSYIVDLRAATQMEIDFKIFRMNYLGIPQERIATRLGLDQKTIHYHLGKKAELPFSLNTDLLKGFTVPQVAEKHGWTEPIVWSIALEGKSDLDRFKAVNWGLRTWDLWNWNDCDKRFGDDWPARHRSRPKEAVSTAQGVRSGEAGGPGRIPAQMIAHILYYFSDQNDLVLDPNFKKQSNNYDPDGISGLSKEKYLKFLESFFALAHLNAKKSTQMAFINADWRDFQNTPAKNETRVNSILINDYLWILNQSGWQETHIFQAPLSSERFKANVVSAMQKKKIIGVTSRYVIILKKK